VSALTALFAAESAACDASAAAGYAAETELAYYRARLARLEAEKAAGRDDEVHAVHTRRMIADIEARLAMPQSFRLTACPCCGATTMAVPVEAVSP
jgi:hypothetical protein